MPTLPGLESFELVTLKTKTRVPLEGALVGWADDVQHRLVEHVLINRNGVIHQSRGQGPRRFVFRCLVRNPGATAAYRRTEALLAREPFSSLIHPRFGAVPVVFVGLKAAEDMDQRTSALIAELSLCETGLREVAKQSPASTARQATQAAQQAQVLAASSLVLVAPAAALVGAALAFQGLLDEAAALQTDLARSLATLLAAADALTAVAVRSIRLFPVVAQARLTAYYALAAYQDSGARLPPVREATVPARMSLARFVRSLYGGGRADMELEIARLNRIANPHALPPGTVLLLPDPAAVVEVLPS